MNHLPSTTPVRRSRGRTVVFIILGILACLILAPVIGLVAWRHHQSAQIEVRLKAIRDAGYPASALDLDRWYPAVPDASNAALRYAEAAGQIVDGDTEAERDFQSALAAGPPYEALTPVQKKHLVTRLADNREALDLVRRATQLPDSRYPVDLSTGFNALLPHLAEIRKLAHLLRDEAVFEADAGHGERAVQSIEDGAALARSLAQEPLLISYLVRVAANAILVSGAEQVMNRVKLSAVELARLERALASGHDTNAVVRALAGERAAAIGIFRMDPDQAAALLSQGGGPSPVQLRGLSALNRMTGLLDRDLVFYLDTMRMLIDSAATAPSDLTEAARQFDERTAEARRRYYILTAMIVPALGKTLERDTDNAARIRVARTAIAIERYRLEHDGRVPDSIQALPPAFLEAIPLDPFTGDPLRFHKQAKGYVVYSVGANRVDDGGERPMKGRRGSPPDITFTVER